MVMNSSIAWNNSQKNGYEYDFISHSRVSPFVFILVLARAKSFKQPLFLKAKSRFLYWKFLPSPLTGMGNQDQKSSTKVFTTKNCMMIVEWPLWFKFFNMFAVTTCLHLENIVSSFINKLWYKMWEPKESICINNTT